MPQPARKVALPFAVGDTVVVRDPTPNSPVNQREGIVEYVPPDGDWPYVVSVPNSVQARTNPNEPPPTAYPAGQLIAQDQDPTRDFEVSDDLPAELLAALKNRNQQAMILLEEARTPTSTGITEGEPAPEPTPEVKPTRPAGGMLWPPGRG